ncbi:MAG: class I SAM-dependent rRNA methyltransferase [Dysgonamonadaceae bacterium]|jgi:23S rRNA (cytosine1962-C5)-methyltransferase|nr:class I SAM-dependent rRNA methyltransferase [Dysgonamonadaceae bacterium]
MSYKKVYLSPKKEESLQRFHPWVFSGAIHRIDGTPEEGEIVEIYDSKNHFLALGHCQIGSIAVRILSFELEPIDTTFWKKRLAMAYQLRQQLGLTHQPPNNTYRLVHGEGDLLPGLIIDIYGNTAVVQAHSPGMHLARYELADALKETLGSAIENIYYKSEDTLPYKADLGAENGYLLGGENASSIAWENGLRFRVDWVKGQKTGFFVDQRENRNLLERYAQDRNVLNLFCYTGGFSCYALRGGARSVHSVDSSAKAMALTNENIALNFPDNTPHQSFTEDVFKYLDQTPHRYDLIILDPPAFAKRRNVLKNALQGYRKLNTVALEKIQPGGIIFTFSCSQVVSKNDFRLAVFSAAAQSGRKVRILQQLSQPADHPINIYHPEGEYLKGLILEVE